jgi:glyoxylase-like metal-dependent hydrolase (beta-lactamase superfamily II)
MEKIAPTVYIETGYPGVNVGAIATEKGVVCIDAPTRPRDAEDWLEAIHSTIGEPIQYLILTDYQGDRALCGAMFHSCGIAQEETRDVLQTYAARFPAPVLESIALRYGMNRKDMNGATVIHPQISFCEQSTLQLGSHRIDLIHAPGATPGTLWVLENQDRVLFVGDTLVVGQHPPLAEARTLSWLSALSHLQHIDTEAEIIVPGRGPLPNGQTIEALASFIQTARGEVRALYRAGRPRAETSGLVPDFLDFFAPPDPRTDGTIEWLQKQLKAGLDHLYDECKAEAAGR